MSRKIKSLFIGLGIIAMLNLLVLIPGSGFFLILTIAPLLAGYICAKYEKVKNYRNAVVIGISWSAVQTAFILLLAFSILSAIPLTVGICEILIFATIFICNTCFCILGNKLA
ncbi:MAG: hypothetical protein AB1485_09150 [Candidatus Thermoplasmatota archaeon]